MIEHGLIKVGIGSASLGSVALVAVSGVLAWRVWKDYCLLKVEREKTQQLQTEVQQLSRQVGQLYNRQTAISSSIGNIRKFLLNDQAKPEST